VSLKRACIVPELKLVLRHLLDLCKLMQLTEQLDAVVRLNVMKPVAEHLQQRVQNSPRMALEHTWQQLTYKLHKFHSEKVKCKL